MGLPVAAMIALLVLGGFYISPQDELSTADAIVVISGGDTEARTIEGVELYQANWAPLLIFSGAALDPSSPSNARQMSDIAIDQGIPPDVIALEEQSKNTRQNANQVSAILQALKSDKIILVTSPYHQRRASIEFKQRIGKDVEVVNHSAQDVSWSRAWWWTNPHGWYLTATEIPKALFAHLNQRLSPSF